ncbi:hypothetical protein AVEN_102107-1 [Araneus ventricosus]|uniref:Uncharacterized protein n=1 Tax=Araneus ventricosus TaxID=182803 RepID=A0A4Y2V4H0_ARAVE|nr:hypothetical protein AVEN_102107-1 [Araneus ventricosus]
MDEKLAPKKVAPPNVKTTAAKDPPPKKKAEKGPGKKSVNASKKAPASVKSKKQKPKVAPSGNNAASGKYANHNDVKTNTITLPSRDPLPDLSMPTVPVSSQVASTGAAVLPRNVKPLKHPQPLKAVVTDGSLDCQFCEYRVLSAKALRVHLIQVHRIQEQQRHKPTSQDPGPGPANSERPPTPPVVPHADFMVAAYGLTTILRPFASESSEIDRLID